MPVFCAKIALVSRSAAVDDDSKDDEADYSQDLDNTENEFDYLQ